MDFFSLIFIEMLPWTMSSKLLMIRYFQSSFYGKHSPMTRQDVAIRELWFIIKVVSDERTVITYFVMFSKS